MKLPVSIALLFQRGHIDLVGLYAGLKPVRTVAG